MGKNQWVEFWWVVIYGKISCGRMACWKLTVGNCQWVNDVHAIGQWVQILWVAGWWDFDCVGKWHSTIRLKAVI